MIRVGIIGTGVVAREHAKAIAMLPRRTVLLAAADTAAERLQEFCAAFRVSRRYHAGSDLIADPDLDLVAIATPPALHEPLAVAALERGKYVFCEKPLAQSLAGALRIAEAEARYPGRLAVSYQMRHDASVRRLLSLCESGAIGDIQSVAIERHSYVPHFNPGKAGWWGSWDVAGGGVLITQLIHELDLLLLVMGTPVCVNARMDTRYTEIESEDHVEAAFRFADGRVANCIATVNSGRLGGRFTVTGAEGTIDLGDIRPPSPSIAGRALRSLARRLGIRQQGELTPHALLYQAIAEKMDRSEALPIPPKEALRSLELCMAAYESALSGREVSLPLAPDSAVHGGVSKEAYAARKRAVRAVADRKEVRVGFVGLDTSHAPTFAKILHDPYDPLHIPGARVVAAYPGGSPDMSISISRVAGFTSELRDKYGVRILDSPERVAAACDLVFVLAADGRAHPALFGAVAAPGRPVFVDKPFAISVADAAGMYALAAQTGTRVFATSAFRYADGLIEALHSIRRAGERVRSCLVRCWLPIEETQGRYFWYGIHAAEMLVAIMGPGACEVEATATAEQDNITVWHDDGRQSRILGSRSDRTFQVSVETENRRLEVNLAASMASLPARVLWSALDVLTEGRFPRVWAATSAGSVAGDRPGRAFDPQPAQTMEIVRLLEAAQRSHASRQRVPC